MAAVDMDRKRKDMDDSRQENDQNAEKVPRIQGSSTIKIIEERNPSRNEMTLTLMDDQVKNICKHSYYLREVITLASSDEASTIIVLKEKDVNLAAQFLIILGDLDNHNDPAALPNLSYNLGFADLASKWIVGVYVSYFQNYIKSTLIELCDAKPILVFSNEDIFPDKICSKRTEKMLPSKDAGGRTIYLGFDCSAMQDGDIWKLRIRGDYYSFPNRTIHQL
jgi:hypothetical protein